jgi:hypothetical protein
MQPSFIKSGQFESLKERTMKSARERGIKVILTIGTFLVIFSQLVGCAVNPLGNQGPSPNIDNNAINTPVYQTVTGNVTRLKTVSVVDQQGIGIEAFSLLVPVDWQFEGEIKWVLDNPGMPASSSFKVSNPKSKELFELFPSQALFWTDNQLTTQLFPIGSKYFGNEVRPMVSASQAIRDIVIPRMRPNVAGLKVISEGALSEKGGGQQQSSLKTTHEGWKTRIEYIEGGVAYEDEIYCAIDATYYPIQSMFGTTTNIIWYINNIASFRAEKGKLDASAKIFQTMAYSIKLNLKWFNKYVQVIEYLIKQQIQQIKSVGELGSIIAKTGDEIRQENLQLYKEQQARSDANAENFSNYIRGVDKYYDPLKGENVELPSGYDNVWTNNLGEYVLAESPSYNPNIGSNLNWQPVPRAK